MFKLTVYLKICHSAASPCAGVQINNITVTARRRRAVDVACIFWILQSLITSRMTLMFRFRFEVYEMYAPVQSAVTWHIQSIKIFGQYVQIRKYDDLVVYITSKVHRHQETFNCCSVHNKTLFRFLIGTFVLNVLNVFQYYQFLQFL
jgi:hypothetical protein